MRTFILACCIHLCTVNYVRLTDAIVCENLGKEIIIYDEKVKEKAKNMMENERKKKENRVSVRLIALTTQSANTR